MDSPVEGFVRIKTPKTGLGYKASVLSLPPQTTAYAGGVCAPSLRCGRAERSNSVCTDFPVAAQGLRLRSCVRVCWKIISCLLCPGERGCKERLCHQKWSALNPEYVNFNLFC